MVDGEYSDAQFHNSSDTISMFTVYKSIVPIIFSLPNMLFPTLILTDCSFIVFATAGGGTGERCHTLSGWKGGNNGHLPRSTWTRTLPVKLLHTTFDGPGVLSGAFLTNQER
jgi:hypothetical protein